MVVVVVVVGDVIMAKEESLKFDIGGEINVNGESVAERSVGTVVDIGIFVLVVVVDDDDDDGKYGGGGGRGGDI